MRKKGKGLVVGVFALVIFTGAKSSFAAQAEKRFIVIDDITGTRTEAEIVVVPGIAGPEFIVIDDITGT
jgi:hypothetical protein